MPPMTVATVAPRSNSPPGAASTVPTASMPRILGRRTPGEWPRRVNSSERFKAEGPDADQDLAAGRASGTGTDSSRSASGPPGACSTAGLHGPHGGGAVTEAQAAGTTMSNRASRMSPLPTGSMTRSERPLPERRFFSADPFSCPALQVQLADQQGAPLRADLEVGCAAACPRTARAGSCRSDSARPSPSWSRRTRRSARPRSRCPARPDAGTSHRRRTARSRSPRPRRARRPRRAGRLPSASRSPLATPPPKCTRSLFCGIGEMG